MAYGKSQLTNPEVIRLELAPMPPEHDALLRHTGAQLKRAANRCVMSWLTYHERAGTLLRMAANQPVHPCPPDLCARWLREAQALCPDVHCATVLAVTNWLAQTITSQKSPRANEKRWRRVLRNDESHWSFERDLPIRLWNGNAKMERCDDGLAVVVRVDRFEIAGRKTAGSTPLRLLLARPKQSHRTAGHRLAWLAAAEIADGARPLAQSQLIRDGGKWFLMLTVNGPAPAEHAERDAGRVLVVRPGRAGALRIHADTITGEFGEEALDRVSRIRAQLDARRESWRKAHDGAPLNQRMQDNLDAIWRRQSTAICYALVDEVYRAMKDRSFGRVLWLDGNNRTAALALAGKSGANDPRELFPFHGLRQKAARRLAELGIEVVERANFRSVKRRVAEHRKRASGGVSGKKPGAARGSNGATTCARKLEKTKGGA